MLTYKTMIKILQEIKEPENIACTHNFREKYGVSLVPFKALKLLRLIKTRVPDCGSHCEKYQDCKWIETFENMKSKSKYQISKEGIKILTQIKNISPEEKEIKNILQGIITKLEIPDIIISILMDKKDGLSIELLIRKMMYQIKISNYDIRTSLGDILDLMVSLEVIMEKEGLLYSYA